MNFYRWLVVGALVVVGAGIAKADGGGVDPTVKITVPADPSCTDPNTVCFSSNSPGDPVVIAGPATTALPFDLTTTFIYTTCTASDGDDCVSGTLPTLDDLYLLINPTIMGDIYNCVLATTALEAAFNACNGVSVVTYDGNSDLLLQLSCNSTPNSPCTGLLAGEAGTAEVFPEPSDFILLGIGILLIGLYDFRRRKLFMPIDNTRRKLASSST